MRYEKLQTELDEGPCVAACRTGLAVSVPDRHQPVSGRCEAALHDSLTGLPNRVLMLERLEHAFTHAKRTSGTCAVPFVDLNRFKRVNDTYGHQVGDELLVVVAERLLTALRPSDTLARMSGDGFVILCEDLDDPSRADAIAVRVDGALARPFMLSGIEVHMTASIGIAFTGRVSNSAVDLIRDADLAMYQSKRGSAGQRQVFDLREPHLAGDQAGLEQFLRGPRNGANWASSTSRSCTRPTVV